jgi:hypothetical protein
MKIILILLTVITLSSCKSSEKVNCDAYGKNNVKETTVTYS